MGSEPKKRHSKGRQGKRRAAIHLQTASFSMCQNCGTPVPAHTVCKACGYYKGKQIITR